MNHVATPDFWDCYERLPDTIRKLADRNFERLKSDPFHPSLDFKHTGRFWSVRAGLHHRALAIKDSGDMIWFWIGSHADYDRLLR